MHPSTLSPEVEHNSTSSGKLLGGDPLSDDLRYAPGWPGIEPRWTSSAKTGVGTALSLQSRLWFTLSHGILNEIYFPRVDQACTRDFGLIVTDGREFFSEEKRHCTFQNLPIEPGVPAYQLTNTCETGRYRIEKEVLTDPWRNVVLQKIRFVPQQGNLRDYRLYALLSPHLANFGSGNTGWLAGLVAKFPHDVGVRPRGKWKHRADRRNRPGRLRRRVHPRAWLWRNLGGSRPASPLFPAHFLCDYPQRLRHSLAELAAHTEAARRAAAGKRFVPGQRCSSAHPRIQGLPRRNHRQPLHSLGLQQGRRGSRRLSPYLAARSGRECRRIAGRRRSRRRSPRVALSRGHTGSRRLLGAEHVVGWASLLERLADG